MTDQYILTPYYVDQPLPGLDRYANAGWWRNDPPLPTLSAQERLIELYRPLQNKVLKAVQDGKRPVSIAGDCCTSLAILSGLQQANLYPALIWLDAHGDFNTWETTPSGFLGGMPLAMLVGRGDQTIVNGLGLRNLPEEDVYLCGGRDLDPGEREALNSSGVHHLKQLPEPTEFQLPDKLLYVHFDTDFVDSTDAPAMNYPTPGGPSVAAIRTFFSYLAKTGQVAAVSVSSWNPELDEDGESARLIWELLADLLG